MKLNITLWSKKNLECPTCKSDRIVLIFFQSDALARAIRLLDNDRLCLLLDASFGRDSQWLCKNCYDMGKVCIE